MAIPALSSDCNEFSKSLNSNRVEHLLSGGFAVGLHRHIRTTNDFLAAIEISSATSIANTPCPRP